MISSNSRRFAVAGAAVVASGAVAAGTMTVATAAPSAVDTSMVKTVAAPQANVLSAKQKRLIVKRQNKRQFGLYNLPVGKNSIRKYHLKKRDLLQIRKAKRFARSSKARSVRNCESGGNYRTNTGNGYYGAYQFDRGTWISNGGGRYASTANRAPKFGQDHIMWKTQRARGWSPWACA